MYRIYDVNLSKQSVQTGEQLVISVSLLSWDFLKKNMTWSTINSNFSKWGDLIEQSS